MFCAGLVTWVVLDERHRPAFASKEAAHAALASDADPVVDVSRLAFEGTTVKALLARMLARDPTRRPSAREVLRSDFFDAHGATTLVRATLVAATGARDAVDALAASLDARFGAVMARLGDIHADVALTRRLVANSRGDTCPRLFLLVPAAADTRGPAETRGLLNRMLDKGKALVAVRWRLYLLCEGADEQSHFVEGTAPLEMDVPKEALVKAAPYLKFVAGALAVAVKVTTGVALPDFLQGSGLGDAAGALLGAATSAVAAAGGLDLGSISDKLEAAAGAIDASAEPAERIDALAKNLQVRAALLTVTVVVVRVHNGYNAHTFAHGAARCV